MLTVLADLIAYATIGTLLYDFVWMFYRNAKGYVYDQRDFGFDPHTRCMNNIIRNYGDISLLFLFFGGVYVVCDIMTAIANKDLHHLDTAIFVTQLIYVISFVLYFSVATILKHARAVVTLRKLKDNQ